jgi:hypothetical protein
MRALLAVICAAVLSAAALAYAFQPSSDDRTSSVLQDATTSELPHIAPQPMFYERDNFQRAIAKAETVEPKDNIRAIVVPQHLLASELVAQQLKRASGRSIRHIILIGPNHFNSGVGAIATAHAAWLTPLGDVRSDADLTKTCISDLDLLDQPEIFTNEHAVGAIVPFIKYYLPEAQILPIVFNSYAKESDVERVGAWLADQLPDDSLIIYSIDFSHYLTREKADQKDAETRELIERKDLERIMTLGNDHLDSPASLATALWYAKAKHLNTTILSVTNSDDYAVERTPETTSYFSIMFTD